MCLRYVSIVSLSLLYTYILFRANACKYAHCGDRIPILFTSWLKHVKCSSLAVCTHVFVRLVITHLSNPYSMMLHDNWLCLVMVGHGTVSDGWWQAPNLGLKHTATNKAHSPQRDDLWSMAGAHTSTLLASTDFSGISGGGQVFGQMLWIKQRLSRYYAIGNWETVIICLFHSTLAATCYTPLQVT